MRMKSLSKNCERKSSHKTNLKTKLPKPYCEID